MINIIEIFADKIAHGEIEIYSEFSLQHEFGILLRNYLNDVKIQFERNVSYFFNQPKMFIKKEIDLTVFSPDKHELLYAIEFKYPRNGQYPEQMYNFCKDISFLEQLHNAGFINTYFIAFADDHLFYDGSTNGIYQYFRGSMPLTGKISKPTGDKKGFVEIRGSYSIKWNTVMNNLKYTIIKIKFREYI